jgi:hypothetical protein
MVASSQRGMESDLVLSPWELVSKISDDLTLFRGDVMDAGRKRFWGGLAWVGTAPHEGAEALRPKT